jgi:LmbE family N-acetylglucosaminyl deacetylase
MNLGKTGRVLILAPHTDDGEFGCGGTIARLCDMEAEVHYIAFSDCESSIRESCPQLPQNILVQELLKATARLGIPSSRVKVENFEVRHFERDRQAILEKMVKVERDLKPDLVFLPSRNDLHQDHNTIAMEGLRAFKRSSTILGYEMPWNNLVFETTAFICISESQIKAKIEALRFYESQKLRYYATEEFIRALAVSRGVQIGEKYAEAFEVLRLLMK